LQLLHNSAGQQLFQQSYLRAIQYEPETPVDHFSPTNSTAKVKQSADGEGYQSDAKLPIVQSYPSSTSKTVSNEILNGHVLIKQHIN